MSEPFEFTIPGDPLALSPNTRLHPMERARRVKDWKARAYFAWIAAGGRRFEVPVRVTVTIRRGRTVDPDNAAASLKAAFDGLCYNRWHAERSRLAMLPGDSAAWIEHGPVRLETGDKWRRREEVVISVTPRGMMEELKS